MAVQDLDTAAEEQAWLAEIRYFAPFEPRIRHLLDRHELAQTDIAQRLTRLAAQEPGQSGAWYLVALHDELPAGGRDCLAFDY